MHRKTSPVAFPDTGADEDSGSWWEEQLVGPLGGAHAGRVARAEVTSECFPVGSVRERGVTLPGHGETLRLRNLLVETDKSRNKLML
ncbi:hypothetical protein RRG08_028963 [Elysia crispata]|uniref:Uncharacterized protein n=1 Tax=Elysia crispata TaxID=231223 RepID=A0AAE1AQG2_9GAST|nr:hypothetical protein RRG08_028963 [Elysia crispata]